LCYFKPSTTRRIRSSTSLRAQIRPEHLAPVACAFWTSKVAMPCARRLHCGVETRRRERLDWLLVLLQLVSQIQRETSQIRPLQARHYDDTPSALSSRFLLHCCHTCTHMCYITSHRRDPFVHPSHLRNTRPTTDAQALSMSRHTRTRCIQVERTSDFVSRVLVLTGVLRCAPTSR